MTKKFSSYHCEFIIKPNHGHDFKYENWCARFLSRLKTLIHELICVNFFNQHPSKMTIEPSQWEKNCAMRTEPTTPSIKKGRHMIIEDLLKCALMLLFFISIKLKVFRFTQNETPKMVKIPASTNDLFQPKMSPSLSFSGMYRKSFIHRRNRTNSQ